MAAAIQSSASTALTGIANKIKASGPNADSDSEYWWQTSGTDLARMLNEADYPPEVKESFLKWYHDTICPALGGRPGPNSGMATIGCDGNPFEYSFELKSNAKTQSVRFVVDLTQLRPANPSKPLSISNTQKVIDTMIKKTPGFDDTWYLALQDWFVFSNLPAEEQQNLVKASRFQSSIVIGFDISKKLGAAGELPVMGKVYFLPCFAAAYKKITYWQATRQSLLQLPGVNKYPNITKSVNMINDYLATKPEAWQMGTRFLATDLVAPEKARFKVYLRCFGTSFEEIWDFYTLGGRIPDLDCDREAFRELMDMVSGTTYAASRNDRDMSMDRFQRVEQKLTACYFAISSDKPYPGPKLCVYPANFAPNDEVIAKGLDRWLLKYGWREETQKTMEAQIRDVL